MPCFRKICGFGAGLRHLDDADLAGNSPISVGGYLGIRSELVIDGEVSRSQRGFVFVDSRDILLILLILLILRNFRPSRIRAQGRIS